MTKAIEDKIHQDLLPQPFGKAGKIWVTILMAICFVGMIAYYRQLKYGLSVTAMRDYASWGIYISNFVFFVAISLVGSLITAILRLSDVHWSTPLTRISEIIAVSAILFASVIIVVDMGRPDRFIYLIIYGRLQSPIVWDVLVITTYLVLSVLLLYIPLLPDLAILIKSKIKVDRWVFKIARFLGSFWKGTSAQERILQKSINVLVITIIPVALAIHTVTSWLFATTYRAGWDSTNFGAYFVSGAFLVGAGGVIIAMYIFRKFYRLENYITETHFDKMGKLLVMLALLYLYFNINEYLTPAFKMKKAEEDHLRGLLTGDFAFLFWTVILVGMVLPIVVMLFPKGRKPLPMFVMALFVVVAAWFKRFLIVTPTLLHPFLPMSNVPESYQHYIPTWEEWAITIASLAGSLLVVTFLARILPIVPIDETVKERIQEDKNARVNKTHKKLENVPMTNVIIFIASILVPLNVQSQEKVNPRIDLQYFQEDSSIHYLSVKVRKKIDKRFEPIGNMEVSLYQEMESESIRLGSIITNTKGEGKLKLPESFNTMSFEFSEYQFTAKTSAGVDTSEASESITILPGRLKIFTEDVDGKSIRILVQSRATQEWTPVADAEVKVFIKRTFGQLQVGEDFYTSDENGLVELQFESEVPGDKVGNIILGCAVEDHDELGNLSAFTIVKWGIPFEEVNRSNERTLWAARNKTPIWLLIFPNLIIAGVLAVIVYLFFQIFRMKRAMNDK